MSGAAIDLKGKGLKGNGTRVTLGGKKVKVLAARASSLRIIVPNLKPGTHKLVVRRGDHSASGRLRVLKPFNGTIETSPDQARAESGTVGSAGGELTATGADGTRYTLEVPSGALAVDQQITVTPVKRFSGLPFSGKALGAELAPDGLQFHIPATLTITSSERLPDGIVGFGYANSSSVLELQAPSGSGRSRVLRIEHFSTGAVAGSNPADFANAVQPLLVEQPMREDVIELVIDLIGAYEAAFPPAFCSTQPACENAIVKGLDSLETRIQARCANPQSAPAISAVRDIVRMEALRQRLGAQDDISIACREQIMRLVFDPARQAACGGDPLGRHSLIVNPALDEGGVSDLDQDGELTHLEFVHFLVGQLQIAGLDDMSAEAQDCFFTALEALPAQGRVLCASDRPAAEHNLQRALDYAQGLNLVLRPYVDALNFCRVEVGVTPATVVLDAGDQRQFAAVVTGVLDTAANGGVTWSAPGGAITAAGLYTAPSTSGTYEVMATSAVNPSRSATATVTVQGSDAGTYVGTFSRCDEDDEGSCDSPHTGPARAILEISGSSFTLYIRDENAVPNPATCGVSLEVSCWKVTGTRSGSTYTGSGTNGPHLTGQLQATISGGVLNGRIAPSSCETCRTDYHLTREP